MVPDKVADALAQTDYQGAIGRIKFDKGHQAVYGDNPKQTAIGAAVQWRKGKKVVIFPDSIAETKIGKPAWMKWK